MQVHLVQGETGEYDDRCEWTVCAFQSRQDAKRFAYKLNRILKNYGIDKFEVARRIPPKIEEKLLKLDPKFQCSYTGTEYSVLTVELVADSEVLTSDIFDI